MKTLEDRIRYDGWSFIRRILCQGHAQQQDYAAGKYADYEEFQARVDAAARERIDELYELVGLSPEAPPG